MSELNPYAAESAAVARRVRGAWVVAVVVLLVGLAAASAAAYHVPYYSIAPGEAVPVPPLVKITGADTYRPEGQVLLTTVTLGEVSALDALRGWLDPDVDVVARDKIVPPKTDRDTFRRMNLHEMDVSKQTAVGVALETLGYDAVKGDGAEVVRVEKGHPADGVLHDGDVVNGIDGVPVDLDATAIALLGSRHPGERVTLTVRRGGADVQVPITLGRRPGHPAKPYLGVLLQTKNLRFDLPYQVDIASDRIGGPSAGLAFTLEVLDLLTPGELTGGHRVATTGTIELDGHVGPVGGVAQKTVAVRRSGAELFLVPRAEVSEARRHAGRLRVEGVGTLGDALRILASLGGNGLALGQPGAGRS